MAEHPDVQRFQRALEARSRAAGERDNRELIENLFADEVIWHGAGTSGDVVTGKDEVGRLWSAAPVNGNGGPGIDVGEVYADGRHAIAVLEHSVKRRAEGRSGPRLPPGRGRAGHRALEPAHRACDRRRTHAR
jgi:hypothetical protein